MSVTIDWWTLGLQTVNFLVLVWLLQRFLYRPVLAVIARRKALSDAAFAAADKARADAAASEQRYAAAQQTLQHERQAVLEQAHRDAEADRDRMIEAARAEAARIAGEARRSIDAERDVTFAEMRGELAAMACDMAGRLLATLAADVPGQAVLSRLEAALEGMSEEERQRLDGALTDPDANATVTTAVALTQADRDAWTERLAAALGRDIPISFTVDPTLIGGADLHLPHTVIGDSWAGRLAEARGALEHD